MSIGNLPVGTSSGPKTSSFQVKNGQGTLVGIFVSSATGATFKAWDSLTAAGDVLFDTTVALTATEPKFVPVNMAFATGCFITIGGTTSCAAVYA
jgi:hypothetical protein